MKCKADKHAAEHHRGHEQGTVGAVALDRDGRLFAATSTGGTCCKLPGRVGDSPLIGCGCYADSAAGGVSCTGYGDAIMKIINANAAADLLVHPLPPRSHHRIRQRLFLPSLPALLDSAGVPEISPPPGSLLRRLRTISREEASLARLHYRKVPEPSSSLPIPTAPKSSWTKN